MRYLRRVLVPVLALLLGLLVPRGGGGGALLVLGAGGGSARLVLPIPRAGTGTLPLNSTMSLGQLVATDDLSSRK